jgi:hypothetical protein
MLAALLGAVPATGASRSSVAPAADPASGVTASSPVPGGELDAVLDSTQHWVGVNDVLLTVLDASGTRLADLGWPLLVELTGPSGQLLRAVPAIERFATYGRRLYRARVPLDEVGRWQVRVIATDGGAELEAATMLEVWPDQGTPALGAAVPGGATPTMRDARNMMHRISSDPEPLTAFYIWSLDEALREGQPTVFVLDSYAFRPNAACGGALGMLHEIFIDYPGLVVIHAEPWHMAPDDEGMLRLDPPDGPAVVTAVARAEPPWVFVIDRDGRLQAKFSGVIGSDELRAAITSITPWRPAA